MSPSRVSLKPDYSAARANALERACTESARNSAGIRTAASDDPVVDMLIRGAVAPATTSTPSWASQLALAAVGDFIASLAPLSAGARLIHGSMRVSLDGVNTMGFPRRANALTTDEVLWVQEGAMIPVPFLAVADAELGPVRRLAAIAVLTRKLIESSAAEVVVGNMLRESAAFSLDASLFSDTAASDARPAGLLAGVAPLVASAVGGDGALRADLASLSAALASVTATMVLIGNPVEANALRFRLDGDVATIWPTIAVAPGTVIAVDPFALASAFGPTPEIQTSKESVLHLEDTAPCRFLARVRQM